jgi:hypothetical protein
MAACVSAHPVSMQILTNRGSLKVGKYTGNCRSRVESPRNGKVALCNRNGNYWAGLLKHLTADCFFCLFQWSESDVSRERSFARLATRRARHGSSRPETPVLLRSVEAVRRLQQFRQWGGRGEERAGCVRAARGWGSTGTPPHAPPRDVSSRLPWIRSGNTRHAPSFLSTAGWKTFSSKWLPHHAMTTYRGAAL